MKQMAAWQQVVPKALVDDPPALEDLKLRMTERMEEDGCYDVAFHPVGTSSCEVEAPRTWLQWLLRRRGKVTKTTVCLLFATGWFDEEDAVTGNKAPFIPDNREDIPTYTEGER